MRNWLRLIRLPAVFTAMADIFLGFFATKEGFEPVSGFLLLLISSTCLYCAGMIFNDVFDREVDGRERPDRPIPSGAISVKAAIGAGAGLLILGVVLAGLVGWLSLVIAASLAVFVLLYDGVLKATPLGPIAMGACRFLNVLLGASTVVVWDYPAVLLTAAGLGVYVLGVTVFARNEAATETGQQTRWWSTRVGLLIVNVGFVILGVMMVTNESSAQTAAIAMIFVVGLSVDLRMARAISSDKPADIQNAVRMMLLSIITLDATLAMFLTGNPLFFLYIAALVIPTIASGRVMSPT